MSSDKRIDLQKMQKLCNEVIALAYLLCYCQSVSRIVWGKNMSNSPGNGLVKRALQLQDRNFQAARFVQRSRKKPII